MRQKYLYQQAVTCLYPNLKLSHQIKKIGIFRHFIKRKKRRHSDCSGIDQMGFLFQEENVRS